MKIQDVLPDEWAKTAYYRYRKFRRELLQAPLVLKKDLCEGCPCFRVKMNENYFETKCIFNKCIRQYPHTLDNGEFT